MDYKQIKGIELNLAKDALYEFKFGIEVSLVVKVKDGKAEWAVNVISKVPKRAGRPKKAISETSYKFVKASELHQGKFYALDDVAGFLRDFLKNGPRYSGEVFEATSGFGWNKKSVYDAARMISVDKRPQGEGKHLRWMWSLNAQTNMAHDASRDAGSVDASKSAWDDAISGNSNESWEKSSW